jgi:hypothetical protein
MESLLRSYNADRYKAQRVSKTVAGYILGAYIAERWCAVFSV